jgi:hypothetical protein
MIYQPNEIGNACDQSELPDENPFFIIKEDPKHVDLGD